MRIKLIAVFIILMMCVKADAQQADSTLTYVTGEGIFLRLGKGDGSRFNIVSTVQSGMQLNSIDSAGKKYKSNRLSLNLVRMSFSGSLLKDKVTMGIVTDFTGVTPILEGWVGISVFNKRGKLIIGQKQAHTNNRLAMADERFAQVMGQTLAGKSNDGISYGALMQSFVVATREGGIFLETGFKAGKWRINPSVSITTGEGQNFFGLQPNTGFKYGGRLDVLPFGYFTKNNAFIAHDIYREEHIKMVVGFAASYNVKAGSATGSENATITGIYNKNGESDLPGYRKLVADVMLKVKGFSFTGEYTDASLYGKELYTNAAATTRLTPQIAGTYYNLGTAYNLQSSYASRSGWAFDVRYTDIKPEFNTGSSRIQSEKWYTGGLNKYMKNNAVRAGLNLSYLERNSVLNPSKRWVGNLAIQITL